MSFDPSKLVPITGNKTQDKPSFNPSKLIPVKTFEDSTDEEIAVPQYKYENDSSTERTFVQIQALSTDDTHNAEKGAWRVGIRNGALGAEANTRLQVDTNGITATGRVKASTFEAVSQTPWQVTNHSVDRVFDADSTSTEELADVLGTLINDLITLGLIKAL